MSETVTLRDQVAIAAMSAIIAKAPFDTSPASEHEEKLFRITRGAFSYADVFMAVRAERDQLNNAASLGEELRLLRQQRDEALAQIEAWRDALQAFQGFTGLFEGSLENGGVATLRAKTMMNGAEFNRACMALHQIIGDTP